MSEHEHIHCHDFLSSLSEYVDGELDPTVCAELERHMCECQRCRIVVDTMKKTVELYQDLEHEPDLPDAVRTRLLARLALSELKVDKKIQSEEPHGS